MMPRTRYRAVVLAAMLALALAAGAVTVRITAPAEPSTIAMRNAAAAMAWAIPVIRQARLARGLPISPVTDPNRTGLIGMEWSPITTTLGSLTAKRTATNPSFAAALVRWLFEAGVREGSVVAVGASGSFPGLIVATIAAVRALGGESITITSVAASSWGANDPAFTWLDMESALAAAGDWSPSIAASLGGEGDDAEGLEPGARALLAASVQRAGVPQLWGRTLGERIAARMVAYERAAGGRPIAAFVNIGGAVANIGTCAEILAVRPGVHRTLPSCRGEPGVLWLMNGRGIPVLHLLHVDGIARAFSLPIDPVPLPQPGQGAPFVRASRITSAAALGGYVLALVVVVRTNRARSRRTKVQVGEPR